MEMIEIIAQTMGSTIAATIDTTERIIPATPVLLFFIVAITESTRLTIHKRITKPGTTNPKSARIIVIGRRITDAMLAIADRAKITAQIIKMIGRIIIKMGIIKQKTNSKTATIVQINANRLIMPGPAIRSVGTTVKRTVRINPRIGMINPTIPSTVAKVLFLGATGSTRTSCGEYT